MSGAIETLKRMQALDNQALAFAEEKEAFLAERRKLEKECAAEEGALAVLAAQTLEVQKKEKGREIEIKTLEDKKARLKAQLLTVKTNKEYSTLQSEIRTVYADIEKMEESGIQELTAIDGLSAQAKEREAQVGAAKERLAQHAAKEAEAFARIDAEIAKLQAEREALAAGVPDEPLALYKRLIAGREGVAVVPVEGTSCGGCFMGLPPQTINLLMGGEAIVQCRSCQRILYLVPVEAAPPPPEKKRKKKDAAS